MADAYIQWHWSRVSDFYEANDQWLTEIFDRHLKNNLPELSGLSAKQAKPHAPKIYRQLKRFRKLIRDYK